MTDSLAADSTKTDSMPAARSFLLAAAGLIALTFVAYVPALTAGFIWDDETYVTHNPTLQTVDGLKKIWTDPRATPQYYPLVHTTFWVEYHLWTLNPFGYHFNNILLHALNAVLLWRILRQLEIGPSWLVAAVFAVHPVHVESVAWVTERKNVLSGFFYLSSALAYLKFALPTFTDSKAGRRWGWYVLSLVLFVAAMLSKTTAVTLPAALILVTWWRAGRVTWRSALLLAPYFAVGLPLALTTIWLEKYVVGAAAIDWRLTFADRILIAGRALWFYAAKLVAPFNLIFNYPRWTVSSAVWWQWLFPIGAISAVIGLWLARNRMSRGPVTAVLFFAGTLFPALGFFDVYPMWFSFVADHFQYLASIGLLTLVVAAIATWIARARVKQLGARTAGFAVLAVLAVLTWRQATIYHDLDTLWADTVQKNPQSWLAHLNWGGLLVDRGRDGEGLTHLRRAVEIKPDHQRARVELADELFKLNRDGEALEQYLLALEIEPEWTAGLNDVRLSIAHTRIGYLYVRNGRMQDALTHFQQAVELDPKNAIWHRNIGTAALQLNLLDLAESHLKMAISLADDFAEAHNELGQVYLAQGKRDEAIQSFRRALALNPNFSPAIENMQRATGQK